MVEKIVKITRFCQPLTHFLPPVNKKTTIHTIYCGFYDKAPFSYYKMQWLGCHFSRRE